MTGGWVQAAKDRYTTALYGLESAREELAGITEAKHPGKYRQAQDALARAQSAHDGAKTAFVALLAQTRTYKRTALVDAFENVLSTKVKLYELQAREEQHALDTLDSVAKKRGTDTVDDLLRTASPNVSLDPWDSVTGQATLLFTDSVMRKVCHL